MAAKKKSKKKSKQRQTKSRADTKKTPAPRKTARKKVAKKQPSRGKAAVKAKARSKKKVAAKKAKSPKKLARSKAQSRDAEAFLPEELETRSGRQSGDLQGLSRVEGADSESVDELLEEGNAFEADVVAGVEDATNSEEKEVRTREVPVDDVPEEYLDED